MAETLRGVVKWFNDAKGFGFIEHESGRDVFVHYSVIEADGFKTLKDGEPVEYELKEGEKGLHAARVSRVNAPPVQASGDEQAATITDTNSADTATSEGMTASSIEVEKIADEKEDDSISPPVVSEDDPTKITA